MLVDISLLQIKVYFLRNVRNERYAYGMLVFYDMIK